MKRRWRNCVILSETEKRLSAEKSCRIDCCSAAPELSRAAIGEAIRKGRFYASTGAEILDWRAEDSGRVTLRCAPAEEIQIGVIGGEGMTLRGENLTEATFDAKPGDIVFARVRAGGGLAWTNPMEI